MVAIEYEEKDGKIRRLEVSEYSQQELSDEHIKCLTKIRIQKNAIDNIKASAEIQVKQIEEEIELLEENTRKLEAFFEKLGIKLPKTLEEYQEKKNESKK